MPVPVIGACSGAVVGGAFGGVAAQMVQCECKWIAAAVAADATIGAGMGAIFGQIGGNSLTEHSNESSLDD